ncbi:MAG: GYF domain-containing protein [Pseudolabrys sp.]
MSDEGQALPPSGPQTPEPVSLKSPTGAALPPHPLDKHWYAHIDGKNYGPFTGHEIKRMIGSGQITESDFLCAEGGTAWTQGKNEPLLGALFREKSKADQPRTSTVSAEGGTVVQVTNNIPSPNMQAALLLDGDAAAKSPGIALLLSLLICGVGQMYNGQVGKGILMLVGCILAWFILLGWIVWIWSMVDAYQTAKKMNLKYQQRVLAGLM